MIEKLGIRLNTMQDKGNPRSSCNEDKKDTVLEWQKIGSRKAEPVRKCLQEDYEQHRGETEGSYLHLEREGGLRKHLCSSR
jgi:hypothetical protein